MNFIHVYDDQDLKKKLTCKLLSITAIMIA